MGCLVGHLFRCFLACGHGLECLLDLEPRRFRGLQRRRRHGEGEEQSDELGRNHGELEDDAMALCVLDWMHDHVVLAFNL